MKMRPTAFTAICESLTMSLFSGQSLQPWFSPKSVKSSGPRESRR
jgi:hypothetical protein